MILRPERLVSDQALFGFLYKAFIGWSFIVWDQEIGGSNPLAPTTLLESMIYIARELPLS
jgi:hypothetical protein